MRVLGFAVALLAGALVDGGTAMAASSCNRTCLQSLANSYMNRLSAGDPKGLPLAPTFKVSENAKTMTLGDGAWAHVADVVQKQVFVDPDTGQALVYSLLRLKNDHKMAAY